MRRQPSLSKIIEQVSVLREQYYELHDQHLKLRSELEELFKKIEALRLMKSRQAALNGKLKTPVPASNLA
jgi:prefoldin subunit 5